MKTFDEFLAWLNDHPEAELTVAQDVWDNLCQNAADIENYPVSPLTGLTIRVSKYLPEGMVWAMVPKMFDAIARREPVAEHCWVSAYGIATQIPTRATRIEEET